MAAPKSAKPRAKGEPKPQPVPKPQYDWESIAAEYRAGQLSVNAIAKCHGLTEAAIRKRAKRDGWERPLVDKVRKAVRERLVRADAGDGSNSGTSAQRARDEELVKAASLRGFEVVSSHRKDLQQLHALKRILAERLSQHLDGVPTDGPCLGERESAGDLLEKLSRVTTRLVPLERQAHNLDEGGDAEGASSAKEPTVIVLPSNSRDSSGEQSG
jgi:hypothetical protein